MNRVLVYPFPMHLSNGYTYHLSILQFVCAMAEFLPIYLIVLDTEAEIAGILRHEFDAEIPNNLRVITVKNRQLGIKSNTLWFRQGVRRALADVMKRYDRIFMYTRNVKLAAYLFPKIRALSNSQVRCIFESHQLFSQNLALANQFKRARVEFTLEERLYKTADLVIVNTPILAKFIERNFSVDAHVIPVAVRNDDVLMSPSALATDFAERQYDFVYTGNFHPWKGVSVLIESLQELQSRGWSGRAKLVGVPDGEFDRWDALLKNMGLGAQVHLSRRLPKKEIASELDDAKIGILPNSLLDDSLFNTSPLKVFDYAGRGLPVVLVRTPATSSGINLPDVVWVEPDSQKSMADGMEQALGQYVSLSNANIAWAMNHTWERRAGRIYQLIDALA